MDQLKQRLQDATQQRQGATGASAHPATSTVIDSVGLRNILPEYDPSQSVAEQYPHVAFTVVKSPARWMSPAVAFSGCWTLSAVVWSDAHSSRQVGPFDWCMPKDQQIRFGPMAAYSLPTVSYVDIYQHATTGIHRTGGPLPPNSLLPDDVKTHNLESQQGMVLPAVSLYSTTAFGTMFGNLLYALGENFGAAADNHDSRVWLVAIEE